jgi:predicted transcriptional regulator
MTIEQAILENVRVLSPQQQQEVLAFIKLLQTDEWEDVYRGRFQQLREEIRVGIDAADRGDLVDAQEVFQQLRVKLQQRREEVG